MELYSILRKTNVALGRKTGLTAGIGWHSQNLPGQEMFECFQGSKWGPCRRERESQRKSTGLSPIEPPRGVERLQKEKNKKKVITIGFLGSEEGIVNYQPEYKCINSGLPYCRRGVLGDAGL